MASSYTSRIRLEKQGSGENANTWGERLNDNVIDLVDTAVAGVTAVDVDGQGGTGITLSENNGSADQGRHAGLRFTGALTADVTVTYGASEKIYFVNNETTGDQNVIMNNGSTKVTVGNGEAALIATNGANSFALRSFESGTRLAFNQNTAPVGWSVITSASHNNAALRIVNAAVSGAQVGGNNSFNSVFNTGITVSITGKSTDTATLTGSTALTTLTTANLPALSGEFDILNRGGASAGSDIVRDVKGIFVETAGPNYGEGWQGESGSQSRNIKISVGSSVGHSHSLAGQGEHSHTMSFDQANAFNLDVKYVNFIVCEKD